MATVKLGHVVNQLLQDSTIISDYGRFYDALDVRYPEYIQLTNRYKNAAAKTCELFYEILQYWVNAEKGNATIFKLCDILKGAEFVNAAGKFIRKLNIICITIRGFRFRYSNIEVSIFQ